MFREYNKNIVISTGVKVPEKIIDECDPSISATAAHIVVYSYEAILGWLSDTLYVFLPHHRLFIYLYQTILRYLFSYYV